MRHPVKTLPRIVQVMVALILLSTILLMSACGRATQEQQTLLQSQARFDQQLNYAQQIGVPTSLLQSLLRTREELRSSNPPFSLFKNQSTDTYYQNLTTRYSLLTLQLQGVITVSTNQARSQTQQRLEDLQRALQLAHNYNQPTGNFAAQLDQAHTEFLKAQYPKDYARISSQIQDAIQGLSLLANTTSPMATLKKVLEQANTLQLEIGPLTSFYQQDIRRLDSITTLRTAQQFNTDVTAHYQQALVTMTLSIPHALTTKLDTLKRQMQLLQVRAQDTMKYQQDIKRYSTMTTRSMSIADYQSLASRLDDDITQIQMTLLRLKAQKLLQQLHSQAEAWGNAHRYYDNYNGQSYPLDIGYLTDGIESDLSDDIANAATIQDLKQVIDQANNALFNLQIMETDLKDRTPYDQMHATDLQLIQHYKLSGQVIIVSLAGQALRLYQDGKLIRAFLVTSGRPERPSLPGLWSIQARFSPITFKSSDPPGSPYWYPDTPIHYAMLYHDGGYFIHDSWWRDDYGPGTQFPHADSSGNQTFAGNGSHGCINLQEEQAAWLYNRTSWGTAVVTY